MSLPLLYPKIHQMFPTKFDFGCINIYFPKKRFIDPSMLAHGKVYARYVQVDIVTMLQLILYNYLFFSVYDTAIWLSDLLTFLYMEKLNKNYLKGYNCQCLLVQKVFRLHIFLIAY